MTVRGLTRGLTHGSDFSPTTRRRLGLNLFDPLTIDADALYYNVRSQDVTLNGSNAKGLNDQASNSLGDTREIQPRRYYNFDGVNDYVVIGDPLLTNSSQTVTGWLYREDATGFDTFLDNSLSTVGGLQILCLDTGVIRVRLDDTGSGFVLADSTTTPGSGEWFHIAVVIDKGVDIRIYINGVLDMTPNDISSLGNIGGTSNMHIGTQVGTGNPYDRRMWDIRFYNEALTAEQIGNIYDDPTTFVYPASSLIGHYKMEEGAGTTSYDSSGNGNDGTVTNATLSTFHASGDNNAPGSFLNEVGYSESGGVIIPRDESDTGNDVLGSALDYSGSVGFDLWQSTAADQPFFDIDANGSLAAITIGQPDLFLETSGRYFTSGVYDIYVIVSSSFLPVTYNNTPIIAQWSSDTSGHMFFGLDGKTPFIKLNDGTTEQTGSHSREMVQGQPTLLNFRGDSSGNHFISVNGGAFEQVITGASTFSSASVNLTLGDHLNTANYPITLIYEVFGVNGNLADADRTTLINYFLNKHGNNDRLMTLGFGQSLQDHKFTQFSGAGEAAYETEGVTYFSDLTDLVEAADQNQYLTKSSYDASGDTGGRYFWDDTASPGSKGAKYTQLVDPILNKSFYTAIHYDLGQSDAINASFPHTKSEYKTLMKELLAQLKSDFPNATILINPINRHDTGSFDTGYQLVREAQLEVIDEVAYVERGVEVYDIAMTDNFHLTEAGNEELGEREARRAAFLRGESVTGTLGPSISNLVAKTDRVEFEITHDGGTDWTVPTAAGGSFAITDDGSAIGIDSVTRTDATNGVIVFNEGEAPAHGSSLVGFVNYGDGSALAADPDVAYDNATNAMPFQSQANLAVTNDDPLQDLDNVLFRLHARGGAKTYSSSNIVDSINSLQGENFSEFVAGEGPEFTDDYLRFARNTDRILLDSDFANTTSFTLGLCGQFPSSMPSFGVIGGFTNTSGNSTNFARLITQNGTISYQADSGNAVEIFGTGISGSDNFIVFLKFTGVDDADLYYNQKTSPTNFDPRDDFSVLERWAFGNATNQSAFVLDYRLYDSFMTSDAIIDTELENIFDYWNDLFNLGL